MPKVEIDLEQLTIRRGESIMLVAYPNHPSPHPNMLIDVSISEDGEVSITADRRVELLHYAEES